MFVINDVEWQILFVHPMSDDLLRSDGSRTVAVCDDNTKCVYVANNIRGRFLRKVLMHEICHSAMFSYNIHMSIEQEELFCDLVATYGDEIVNITDEMFRIIKRRTA